ncbi:hypothetical protein PINS_up023999 [Pythium insidiosum]|nr:hypothetical protein PINS_up023999 [Pythium insidiosum]
MKTTAMTTHYLSGLAGDLEEEQDSDLDHGYGHIQALDFDLDMDLDLDLDPEPFQPLIVNVSAQLANMGTQTYMAMLRRPLEAVRLGVHPVLLVESPHDTAMPPVAFIFCLWVRWRCCICSSGRR